MYNFKNLHHRHRVTTFWKTWICRGNSKTVVEKVWKKAKGREGGGSYGICLVRGNTDLSLPVSSLILYFIAEKNGVEKLRNLFRPGSGNCR